MFVEIVADDVVGEVSDPGAIHVFADRDEFHFRCDDAGAGVGELGDDLAGEGLEGLALGVDGGFEGTEEPFAFGGGVFGVIGGEVAIVARFDGAAFVGFDVVAGLDP